MQEQTVKLTLTRRWMLRTLLTPYDIYVNGEYIGRLKNGKPLVAEIPRRSDYIFNVNDPFRRSSVLSDPDSDSLDVRMEIIGGDASPCEPVFLTRRFGEYQPLEDADYVRNALPPESELDLLDEPRRILARCMLFWDALAEGASSLLYLPRLPEISEALRTVGADGYAEALAHISDEIFAGIDLPLSELEAASSKELQQKLRLADDYMWAKEEGKLHEGVIADFHRAVTRYILENRLF